MAFGITVYDISKNHELKMRYYFHGIYKHFNVLCIAVLKELTLMSLSVTHRDDSFYCFLSDAIPLQY